MFVREEGPIPSGFPLHLIGGIMGHAEAAEDYVWRDARIRRSRGADWQRPLWVSWTAVATSSNSKEFDMSKKVALVTGGSRGLGAATAVALADDD
jgi:hypothetical protein